VGADLSALVGVAAMSAREVGKATIGQIGMNKTFLAQYFQEETMRAKSRSGPKLLHLDLNRMLQRRDTHTVTIFLSVPQTVLLGLIPHIYGLVTKNEGLHLPFISYKIRFSLQGFDCEGLSLSCRRRLVPLCARLHGFLLCWL
jgi:hypothetical protein